MKVDTITIAITPIFVIAVAIAGAVMIFRIAFVVIVGVAVANATGVLLSAEANLLSEELSMSVFYARISLQGNLLIFQTACDQ